MSLIVYPYHIDTESGKHIELEGVTKPFNDLFGPENWRYKVWGSQYLLDNGFIILPTLKNSDIYAEGEDISLLEKELISIKTSIDVLSTKLSVDKDSLLSRIENALKAITVAKININSGVYIG